jgi:hypothetical protein
MSYLNKLQEYPIDLLFVYNYYDKILFTHPKRLKLIALFMTHILLLLILYVAPFLYDNIYFNIFYVCLITAMVCGWILFKGECWINSWEKKILDENYKDGDNLDVNPSIDILSKNICEPIINLVRNILNKQKNDIINEKDYIYYKNVRYKVPLIIPVISLIIFLSIRFKHISIKYKILLIILFLVLTIITHFRWKQIDQFYK